MKYLILVMLAFVALGADIAPAETIYLKDGNIIEGKIAERASYYVVVMVGKMPRKIYTDEIDKIVEEGELPPVEVDPLRLAEVPVAKAELIVRLMHANGAIAGIENNIKNMIEKTDENNRKKIKEMLDFNEIVTRFIPIYAKHYSEEDLKLMIQFYESPVGQKIIGVTPLILGEALNVTAEYFQEKLKQ